MNSNEAKTLTRDVEAAVVPVGTKVTLQKGDLLSEVFNYCSECIAN